ncbi:hypothetical protein [Vibrio caribbeanicus]|uniref:hypothetical protein n=1 Tax=Vibrio caribbeanicus TaxID=701175 RepID=UPI00228496F3|nr:hypothetical protein [Vibrio caribbeanicus]MCY9845935.1 hypothetical protein [Vibrio caribbeanicus]
MRLLKFLASIALLTGCAAQADSEVTITDWVAKTEQCVAMFNESKASFPKDAWFDSLPVEQKRGVVFYLYQEKLFGCSKQEFDALMASLTQSNNKTLIKFFKGLGAFEKPDPKFIKDIDTDQLKKLSSNVVAFNLVNVSKVLNFLN